MPISSLISPIMSLNRKQYLKENRENGNIHCVPNKPEESKTDTNLSWNIREWLRK